MFRLEGSSHGETRFFGLCIKAYK